MIFRKQKSSDNGEVASDVAAKPTSDDDGDYIPAAFGQRAIQIVENAGRSKKDLMRDADISVSTLNRLLRGKGSLFTARTVKKVLMSWGLDVSTLPSLDPAGDEHEAALDERLREGLALLRRLWQLAPDDKYDGELGRLRELVQAYEVIEKIATGTGELSRRKP